jgi:NAD(P)-dependent dehydrogenase (short-subunit alcohol dehydrogenase family)
MTTLIGRAGLITGAGSGIGRASALRLAAAGASVVVADIDEDAARETVALVEQAGGTAVACRCDIAEQTEVDAMVALTVASFGRLDFAHNNAGVMGLQRQAVEYPLDDFDRIMRINVRGTFTCMQAELRVMLEARRGCIVNTASEAALKGSAADAVYTASKHAVAGLTKTAALEYARRGIRINAVCPGVILTGMMQAVEQANPAGFEKAKKLMPIGRYGQPEEVAEAVLWLCSDASSLVTGHLLAVDGGWAVN